MIRVRQLEDWAVVDGGDPFTAPELRSRHLSGMVRERPVRILTSPIATVAGRHVTTRSGSVYVLGQPAPGYLAFLSEHGIALDPEEPIRQATADFQSRAGREPGHLGHGPTIRVRESAAERSPGEGAAEDAPVGLPGVSASRGPA